jgi:2-hydroxy-3-keto-5-methylthiopentenyl-1-phosphate phosphatase
MTLILDWDGTVTVDDTLILALREFGDWQVYLDAAAALRRGEITLHEEIRRDAESITTPIEEVVGSSCGRASTSSPRCTGR